MLYFMLVWSVLFFLSWLVGTTLLTQLQIDCFVRRSDNPNDKPDSCDQTIAAVWLGIVVVADGLLLLSLISPLSPTVGTGLALLVGLLCLSSGPVRTALKRLWRSLSIPRLAALAGWMVLIAMYTTQQVTWFDTGLYHFGAIRWLSQFGTVPGLALLLDNLGFTSSWFALLAPLSPAALAPHSSAVTNGFVLLLATCQGWIALKRWLAGKAQVTDKFIVTFLCLVLPTMTLTTFLSAILVSPSPDIPVIFLTGIVVWSLLTVRNSPKPTEEGQTVGDAALIPLILATGTACIKLSAIPLIPVALLFYTSQRPFHLSRLWIGALTLSLLIFPLLSVSVVTSGCPLYPSSVLCLDVPWRLSAEQAQLATETIRGWDKWFGTPPSDQNRLLWQMWQWLTFARLNLLMLALLIVSALLSKFVIKAARRQGVMGTPWIAGLACLGMMFILLRAPMIRFGLGYFVIIPATAIALLTPSSFIGIGPVRQAFLGKSRPRIVAGALGLTIAVAYWQTDARARLVLPPAMPSVETRTVRSHNIEYVSPMGENVQCWSAPIPCTLHQDLDIQLRNPDRGLRGGFIPASSSS